MTYSENYTIPEELLEQICEEGFDALPELIRIILNTAMQIERQKHLGAGPYERTPERQGYANGYKPKTMATRVGKITFGIPQVRESDFYPSSLEKGIRSERALKLALAEMYVQGVSTRKVAAITEQMCGFEVSSSQVSNVVPPTNGRKEQRQNWMSSCRHGGNVHWDVCGICIWTPVMRRCARMDRFGIQHCFLL